MLLFLPLLLLLSSDVPSVTSVAVLPLRTTGDARAQVTTVLDDLLSASLQSSSQLRVVSKQDLDSILAVEKMKDAVGCTSTACAVELAGALGVDSIVSGSVGALGSKYMLTLAWVDSKRQVAIARCAVTLGKDVEQFDTGVAQAVGILLADAKLERRSAPGAAARAAGPGTCGDANDCLRVARGFADTRVPEDAATGFAAASRACELKAAEGCRRRAGMLYDGRGTAADHETGKKLLDQGCTGGDMESCVDLARVYENNVLERKPSNLDLRALYATACDGKFADACYALGVQLFNADNVAPALLRLDRACGLGAVKSCRFLGEIYSRGRKVPNNAQESSKYYGAGCKAADPASCRQYALQRYEARDYEGAFEANRTACSLGDGQGCYEMAWLLYSGRGVAPDRESSHKLLYRACDMKSADACAGLREWRW